MAIPALALLLGLGVWQLQQLERKTALLQRIETRMADPAVALPTVILDPEAWDYRRVGVEGVFVDDRSLFVASRVHRGEAGFHVVTPLRRTDPAGNGQMLLVNRGWIPLSARETAEWAGFDDTAVSVAGVLRVPPEPGWFQPDDDVAGNLWYGIDLPAMAAATGIDPVPPMILDASADTSGTVLPIGGQTRIDLPNNHLQYAITWFAFAAILVVVYILHHRRHRA
ncbi:MAG: SURF1 family protein [Inquilinus sp.]|nr:SURF1 family protein [Inquilinus sp.]